MSKPWLDAWTRRHPDDVTDCTPQMVDGGDVCIEVHPLPQDEGAQNAAANLVAAAPALARALLMLETCGRGGWDSWDGGMCPTCYQVDPARHGHRAACQLDAALTAAGLPHGSRDDARTEPYK